LVNMEYFIVANIAILIQVLVNLGIRDGKLKFSMQILFGSLVPNSPNRHITWSPRMGQLNRAFSKDGTRTIYKS